MVKDYDNGLCGVDQAVPVLQPSMCRTDMQLPGACTEQQQQTSLQM